MKKFLAFFLVIVFSMSFVGCTSKDDRKREQLEKEVKDSQKIVDMHKDNLDDMARDFENYFNALEKVQNAK